MPATLVQIFAAERSRLVRLIGRIVGCRATAEDLAQDAFLRLWDRRDGCEDAGYLFRTARNIAIDHLRAQRVRDRHAEAAAAEPPAGGVTPDDTASAREELELLHDTLSALPERVQRVFLLNRLDGLSYNDIAVELGVSVSTVEKDMIRALAACRRRLPGRGPR